MKGHSIDGERATIRRGNSRMTVEVIVMTVSVVI